MLMGSAWDRFAFMAGIALCVLRRMHFHFAVIYYWHLYCESRSLPTPFTYTGCRCLTGRSPSVQSIVMVHADARPCNSLRQAELEHLITVSNILEYCRQRADDRLDNLPLR